LLLEFGSWNLRSTIGGYEDLGMRECEDLRSTILGLDHGIWGLVLGIWDLEFGIWNLVFGTWNLELGIWDLELGSSKP
jgi:hypothetical protein